MKKQGVLRTIGSILCLLIMATALVGCDDGKGTSTTSSKASSSYSSSSSSSSGSSSSDDIELEEYYVINVSSKKFHLATCGVGDRIKEANRRISYDTSDELKSKGYLPCGKCCP